MWNPDHKKKLANCHTLLLSAMRFMLQAKEFDDRMYQSNGNMPEQLDLKVERDCAKANCLLLLHQGFELFTEPTTIHWCEHCRQVDGTGRLDALTGELRPIKSIWTPGHGWACAECWGELAQQVDEL